MPSIVTASPARPVPMAATNALQRPQFANPNNPRRSKIEVGSDARETTLAPPDMRLALMSVQFDTRPITSQSDAIADRIAELMEQAEAVDRISRAAHERIAFELDSLTFDARLALN